jgi:predicted Zn-dependent peptidase
MKHTVSEITLNNGAKGLLIHIPDAPVMSFEISFRAGEYLVDEKKWEVPHLMEHVLLGANEMIPRARDFQAELEKNGAYCNASTGVYDITYEAECADFEWERVLGLLNIAITQPLFLEEEFAAEFGNVQEEMAARSNNHFRRLSLEMRKEFGLLVKTDTERLKLMKNVTVADVRDHYRRTHVTGNMRFVIAGNLNGKRSKAIEMMMETIELPEIGSRFELPSEQPNLLDSAIFVPNDTVENLYFYMDTFMRRRMSDRENDALNLINTALTETLYSNILGTARERGLVYGMNSGHNQSRDVTNWWFGAQVSDKNAPALLHIMVAELDKVLTGDIADGDIEAAKLYALGRYQRSAQTVNSTSGGYAGRYFFDGTIEDYGGIPARIEIVTKDDIVAIARAMFADNVWGFGVLGNCGSGFADKMRSQISPLWAEQLLKV